MCAKRRALIVGIDQYQELNPLDAAVNDARAISELLARNEDGSLNYECRLWAGTTPEGQAITRPELRRGIEELFTSFRGDVLFYFAGHGKIGPLGGHLVTSDGVPGDWGVAMDELFRIATHAEANDILIILDCCHAGDLADLHYLPMAAGTRGLAAIREDMTVMAAAMPREASYELNGQGRFTSAVLRALEGSAADPMGWVTASAIYASVERSFGAWPQQPVYKSHATRTTVVRRTQPQLDPRQLQRIVEIFEAEDHQLELDPEYEPAKERGKKNGKDNAEKLADMACLRAYREASLIRALKPGEQLFHTAVKSHKVELTPRGREYWRLVANGKI